MTSGHVASMTRSPRRSGLLPDLRRDAVGREDRGRAVGHLVELLDEAHAPRLEVAHDVAVVDDLAAHVHRPLEAVEGEVDDLDRPHHAGAEAAGRGEQNPPDVGREASFRSHHRAAILSPRRGLRRPRARTVGARRRSSRSEQRRARGRTCRSTARPAPPAARNPRCAQETPRRFGGGVHRFSPSPGPVRAVR